MLKLACRPKKTEDNINTKKNVVMTDCLQAEYSISGQSVIAIFFLYLLCACFFSTCNTGLVYRPNTCDIEFIHSLDIAIYATGYTVT